jgi:S1-C subfamily serine protease
MKGLKAALIPILAGAIAGAVVALILSGGNGNGTQTVTEQVTSGTPTSYTKSGGGLTVNQIYKKDVSGVVDIEVTAETKGSNNSLFGGGSSKSEDEGSGVVYNDQGYILTDEHVIANATKVVVNFNDGYSAPAKVIGSDAGTDLGVIKVDVPQSELHPLAFANSDEAAVGDSVVAIGSPFGQRWTTTAGIVSAVGRVIQAPNLFSISDAIQTDAAINPGNSGGPLLNASGDVIGLNDQIETDENTEGEGQSSGVGFATPANTDVQVAKQIIAGKPVKRAFVDVTLVNAPHGGAEFVRVFSGGPAAKAGIKSGDVVTAVNGQAITSSDDFITVVSKYQPGNTVTFTVKETNGKTSKFKVTLGNQPKEAPGGGSTSTAP